MPFFNKKIDWKPMPARMSRCDCGVPMPNEDLDDFRSITLSLCNKELRFVDGVWINPLRKADIDEYVALNRRYKVLEEENNMCNLKIEVMLDLLAEQASELTKYKMRQSDN